MTDKTVQSQTLATWIASIVAALAFVVSLFSLYESHETRMTTIRDNVTFHVSRYTGDYPLGVKSTRGSMRLGVVEALWEILVSNTGSGTVSLTGYEIYQVAQQGGEILYSGMDKGIFSVDNLAPVNLPITLEAGKSIRLLLKIGISPGENAYKLLCSTVERKQRMMTLEIAEKLLAANGIDIYDNTVVPFWVDGEVSGWSVEKRGNEQNFLLKIRTSRGTEICNITNWYDMKKLQ